MPTSHQHAAEIHQYCTNAVPFDLHTYGMGGFLRVVPAFKPFLLLTFIKIDMLHLASVAPLLVIIKHIGMFYDLVLVVISS